MKETDLYLKTLESLEEELLQINKDFENDKIRLDRQRRDSYEALSRFVHLCEDRKWTTKPKYKYYSHLFWEYGKG